MTGSASTARSKDALWAPGIIVRPDPRKDLSDGVVVRASLVARLLGLKILRVEGDVTLLPAQISTLSYGEPITPVPADGFTYDGTLRDAAGLLARASKTIRETRDYRI